MACGSPVWVNGVVTAARTALMAAASPSVAAKQSTYFKGAAAFHGVMTPGVESVYRAAVAPALPRPLPPATILAVAAALYADAYHEMKHLAVLALHNERRALAPAADAVFTAVEAAFTAAHIADWATCDTTSTRVLAPAIVASPAIAHRVAEWRDSDNIWKRRAAAVTFVGCKLARAEAGYQPLILSICDAAVRHPERFVQLGVGWVLREVSVDNAAAMQAFVASHARWMSREGLRYALEKVPAAVRDAVLAHHRGASAVGTGGTVGDSSAPSAGAGTATGVSSSGDSAVSGTKRKRVALSGSGSSAAGALVTVAAAAVPVTATSETAAKRARRASKGGGGR